MMLVVFIILTNFIRYKHLTKTRKKNPAEPGSNSQGERHQLYSAMPESQAQPTQLIPKKCTWQCQTNSNLGFMQVKKKCEGKGNCKNSPKPLTPWIRLNSKSSTSSSRKKQANLCYFDRSCVHITETHLQNQVCKSARSILLVLLRLCPHLSTPPVIPVLPTGASLARWAWQGLTLLLCPYSPQTTLNWLQEQCFALSKPGQLYIHSEFLEIPPCNVKAQLPMLVHVSKPFLHSFPRGIKAALWQKAGTRLRSCTAPAETALNFSIVTRVKRNIPFTQTRSRRLQTVLLYSYNQHTSDVWSRVALLITISPMVIANTEIARNRNNSESELPLLCIGSWCSQCKSKDGKTLSELLACVTVTPSSFMAFT